MSYRLFYALPLPQALQQQIHHWRLQQPPCQGGRAIPTYNFHLTLAFLGSVNAAQLSLLYATSDTISHPPFTLTLDTLGHWPSPGIVWLGCRHPPALLHHLADSVRLLCRQCGCPPQEQHAFYPHISLYRKVRQFPPQISTPPVWQLACDHFSLYHSPLGSQGAPYVVLKSWPLCKNP